MTSHDGLQGLVGESPVMRALRSRAAKVGPLSLPVLLQGPTGAGKELVARALHESSGRTGKFVGFNVCAVADTMFEDALFGHVRGAFSGAVTDAPGYLREADRGSLFLDEIGALSLCTQPKLLRAIELKEFRPVGARDDRRSDFRVIAATNERLSRLVELDRFRADLAYRLSAIIIDVPPLAQRVDDIPLLVERFAGSMRPGLTSSAFSAAAVQQLQCHAWPGNVRELRSVVETLVECAEHFPISRQDVSDLLCQREATSVSAESFARRRLLELLLQVSGDTGRAAVQLQVRRSTVYRRMQKYGITPAEIKALCSRTEDSTAASARATEFA